MDYKPSAVNPLPIIRDAKKLRGRVLWKVFSPVKLGIQFTHYYGT